MLRSSFHCSLWRGQSSMKTTSAFAPARSVSSMRLRNAFSSWSVKLDVFVLHRQVVDAAIGRRDPAGHLAGLDHPVHERVHECLVVFVRDPACQASLV